jgi:hypothetical protein
MTEPQPLRIESWESMNGTTWAVCEYHAILSMHKSLEEAEAALEAIRRAREERERRYGQAL